MGKVGGLRAAFERLQEDMVSKYINKFEKKYKREPTDKEINDMYKRAKKVVRRNIKKFGVRAAGVIAAVGLGIGGVAIITDKLGDGKNTKTQQETAVEVENEEQTTKDKNNFREGLKVPTLEEKIRAEITGLNTQQELDAYLKNIYIEIYEQKTGDDSLNTSDIQITDSHQNYVYVLDDGRMVSHGGKPYETEAQLNASGENYTIKEDVKVYRVTLAKSGKVIDMITQLGFEEVIPGGSFSEMKDGYESILADDYMSGIVSATFDVEEWKKEADLKPNDKIAQQKWSKAEKGLEDAIIRYYKDKENLKVISYNEPNRDVESGIEPGE